MIKLFYFFLASLIIVATIYLSKLKPAVKKSKKQIVSESLELIPGPDSVGFRFENGWLVLAASQPLPSGSSNLKFKLLCDTLYEGNNYLTFDFKLPVWQKGFYRNKIADTFFIENYKNEKIKMPCFGKEREKVFAYFQQNQSWYQISVFTDTGKFYQLHQEKDDFRIEDEKIIYDYRGGKNGTHCHKAYQLKVGVEEGRLFRQINDEGK